MTEHLPECVEPQTEFPCQQCWEIECECICICNELRACEERVITATVQQIDAMPHSLECVTRDANRNRPCNCLHGDALDAIKGERP
jgi:hypothetical protein